MNINSTTKTIFLAVILIFSTALLFSSCKSNKKGADLTDNQKLAREWMLIEMDVKEGTSFSKDNFVKAKAKLDLTKLKEITTDLEGKRIAQGTAFMGCNNIFFTVSTNIKTDVRNNIEFSQAGMTRMACQENMELETIFGKNLPSMTIYQLEGHYLTLSSTEGKKMKFIASDWD